MSQTERDTGGGSRIRLRPEVISGWSVLFLAELWFAGAGFVQPSVRQGLLELGLIGLAAAAQHHPRAPSWVRSPAVAPVVALTSALLWLWGGTLLAGLVLLLGVGGLGVLLHRARPRAVTVGVVTLVASLLVRAGVHQYWATWDAAGALQRDLRGPLQGGGAGRVGAPPLVFVSIDTLRTDAAATMDSFSRVAEAGRVQHPAVSTSSWTMPAMASALTGELPAVHGAVRTDDGGYRSLSVEQETVAESLRAAGYRTCGVSTNGWLARETGFDQGFDVFVAADEAPPHLLTLTGPVGALKVEAIRDAEDAVDRALECLGDGSLDGTFLWLHLFEPHTPYVHAPSGSAGQVTSELQRVTRSAAGRQAIREAYDAEVAYADRALGRLLDHLEAAGVLERGLVIVASDHGEDFWEQGRAGHGGFHGPRVVDIPLALGGLGVRAGGGGGPASLVDVASTLRAAAGLPTSGVDLRESPPEGRLVVAAGTYYDGYDRSVRSLSERVVVRGEPFGGPQNLRFDLLADPEEEVPLPVDPDHPLLRRVLEEAVPVGAGEARPEGEALRALGYVE